MSPVDDITLSCYLDGELDYDRASEITGQIYSDPNIHDKLVGMVTSLSLLKSYGRSESKKEVPLKLIQTLHQRKKGKLRFFSEMRIFQVAAVVLLFIGSFFIGRQNSSEQRYEPSLFPVIPASLEQTINQVLEYQKSGSAQKWVKMTTGVSARITPVRSFRGSGGEFYRMYLIDLDETDVKKQYWAMAVRSGKEHWQTRGFFTNGTPGSI